MVHNYKGMDLEIALIAEDIERNFTLSNPISSKILKQNMRDLSRVVDTTYFNSFNPYNGKPAPANYLFNFNFSPGSKIEFFFPKGAITHDNAAKIIRIFEALKESTSLGYIPTTNCIDLITDDYISRSENLYDSFNSENNNVYNKYFSENLKSLELEKIEKINFDFEDDYNLFFVNKEDKVIAYNLESIVAGKVSVDPKDFSQKPVREYLWHIASRLEPQEYDGLIQKIEELKKEFAIKYEIFTQEEIEKNPEIIEKLKEANFKMGNLQKIMNYEKGLEIEKQNFIDNYLKSFAKKTAALKNINFDDLKEKTGSFIDLVEFAVDDFYKLRDYIVSSFNSGKAENEKKSFYNLSYDEKLSAISGKVLKMKEGVSKEFFFSKESMDEYCIIHKGFGNLEDLMKDIDKQKFEILPNKINEVFESLKIVYDCSGIDVKKLTIKENLSNEFINKIEEAKNLKDKKAVVEEYKKLSDFNHMMSYLNIILSKDYDLIYAPGKGSKEAQIKSNEKNSFFYLIKYIEKSKIDSDDKKVIILHDSNIDEVHKEMINSIGIEPDKGLLDKIKKTKSFEDLNKKFKKDYQPIFNNYRIYEGNIKRIEKYGLEEFCTVIKSRVEDIFGFLPDDLELNVSKATAFGEKFSRYFEDLCLTPLNENPTEENLKSTNKFFILSYELMKSEKAKMKDSNELPDFDNLLSRIIHYFPIIKMTNLEELNLLKKIDSLIEIIDTNLGRIGQNLGEMKK